MRQVRDAFSRLPDRGLGSLPRGCWVAATITVALVVVLGIWLFRRAFPEAVDPTWERIVESGTLRVCTDPSWPPFEFVDETTAGIEGFDIELAQLLAARLGPGIQAKVVTVGFDGLYDALLSGRCDAVISALPYEPMRTQDVSFSIAYFNAGLVLVASEYTTDIEKVDDLEDLVAGVEWGFVPEGSAQQRVLLSGLGLRRYDTTEDVLRALQTGEIEAALVDRISALAYVRECEGLKLSGAPLTDVNYVIPVRLDAFHLLEETNRALLEMREEGTLDALENRWF
ncbi:ABC transporter substrate-binding protein [Chloroflexota bacterium]